MSKQTIKINGLDNVAVALTDLRTGEEHEGVVLAEDIVKGHKFALTEIAEGEQIIKYGNPIARAVHTIPAGAHVHTHNARTNLSEISNTLTTRSKPTFPKLSRARLTSIAARTVTSA